MSYVLSCCSAVDLTPEHLRERNISFVGFHCMVNGKEYVDDLGQTLTNREFYDFIRAGADTSTSQVSVGEYRDYFRSFLEEGHDILHITLSSGISNTYQSACAAAEMLKKDFPLRRILLVDSLCASSGYGLFLDMLADRRDEGYGLKELYVWAKEHRSDVIHWFCSTDLSYYVKGGRVSKVGGVLGGIFEICPLLNVNPEGKLVVISKVRTKKKVLTALVDKMEQHADKGLAYTGKCYISHSDCPEDAEFVRDLIRKRFWFIKDIPIYYIGTTIGCHTGTGTVALYFTGDEREDN
jgi:DegV family protein with EDD domain